MNFVPANPLSGVMLNDMYQLTMAYAYWKAGKQFVRAVTHAQYWHSNRCGGFPNCCARLNEICAHTTTTARSLPPLT